MHGRRRICGSGERDIEGRVNNGRGLRVEISVTGEQGQEHGAEVYQGQGHHWKSRAEAWVTEKEQGQDNKVGLLSCDNPAKSNNCI